MHTRNLLLLSAIVLVGCTSATSVDDISTNPLSQAQYGDELADTLADIIIQKDPATQEPGYEDMLHDLITDAKEQARIGKEARLAGRSGIFMGVSEEAFGDALYSDGVLYLSPTFLTNPGPELHIYLSTSNDPRQGIFPNIDAIDLGPLQSPYGAQRYTVRDDKSYGSVVLWDTTLGRMYGLAQLSGSN